MGCCSTKQEIPPEIMVLAKSPVQMSGPIVKRKRIFSEIIGPNLLKLENTDHLENLKDPGDFSSIMTESQSSLYASSNSNTTSRRSNNPRSGIPYSVDVNVQYAISVSLHSEENKEGGDSWVSLEENKEEEKDSDAEESKENENLDGEESEDQEVSDSENSERTVLGRIFGEEMSDEDSDMDEIESDYNYGLNASKISKLPKILYNSKLKNPDKSIEKNLKWLKSNNFCSICIDNYEFGEELRFLPCNHGFHQTCVDKWLLMNNKCPLCKTLIK